MDRFLVATHDRDTVRHFLDRLFVAHGLRERLLWRLARVAGPRVSSGVLFDRSWLLDPTRLALGPETDSSASPDRVDRWTRSAALLGVFTGRHGRREGAATPTLGEWHRVILLREYANGKRDRLVVFAFEDGALRPSRVVKLSAREGAGRPLARERDALRYVGDRLPPELKATVPRLLEYRADAETELLVMSHLPGSSAYNQTQNRLRPRRWLARHFRAAADWLASLHRATLMPADRFMPGVEERELASLAQPNHGGGSYYDDLVALARDHRIPLVAGHGDFWSRNMLLSKSRAADHDPPERVGIVDWERFEPASPSWLDLIHFPVSYGINYPWSRYRRASLPEAFRRTFLVENPVSAEVRRYFDRYAERTGFPPAPLEPLLRLYLLRKARDSTGERRRHWLECERLVARAPHTVVSQPF